MVYCILQIEFFPLIFTIVELCKNPNFYTYAILLRRPFRINNNIVYIQFHFHQNGSRKSNFKSIGHSEIKIQFLMHFQIHNCTNDIGQIFVFHFVAASMEQNANMYHKHKHSTYVCYLMYLTNVIMLNVILLILIS